jgi:hypothetical protein
MTPVRIAMAALLLAAPLPAATQSLGSARAQAWVGRPLEVTIPARFEGESGSECVHADVFYGSRRIDARHVQVSAQGAGDDARLRVLVDVPIDEPTVSLAVRTGCRSTMTRSYAVLANPPPVDPPVLARATPAVAGAVTVAVARPRAEPALARAAVATRVAGAGKISALVRRPSPEGGDRPAVLRVSTALANPLGDPAQRAAAALLWQAFNAEPQEMMRTTAMLKSLESELATLRMTAGRTRADMVQARDRTGAATGPAQSGVRLSLALLIALGLGGAAVLWRRGALRGAPVGHWSSVPTPPQEPAPALELTGPDDPPPEAAARHQAGPAGEGAAPLSAYASVAAAKARLAAKVASARARADANLHIFRVDALASALQEAQFLRSLDFQSEAKAVLRAHLADARAPAPMAYYELMQLCGEGENAREIPLLRRRFHEQFKIVAPSKDELNAPGGLEDHPRLLERIASAWPTSRALDIIEQRLFADPESADYRITLEAWRDLIWLYDFAQHMQLSPAAGGEDGFIESAVVAPWAEAEPGVDSDPLNADVGRADNDAVDLDLNAAGLPDEWSEGALALEPLPRAPLAPQ